MERTTRRVGSDSSFARDTRCRSSKRPQSLLNQYLVYIVAWNRTLATDTRHRYHAANKVTKTATRPSRINSSIRHWEKFRSILIHVFSRLLIFNQHHISRDNNWKVLFFTKFLSSGINRCVRGRGRKFLVINWTRLYVDVCREYTGLSNFTRKSRSGWNIISDIFKRKGKEDFFYYHLLCVLISCWEK